MENIRLIAGRSNPDLSEKISKYLGIPLVERKIIDFANSETYVEIQENVRNCKVYVIQTGSTNGNLSVNDIHMESLQIIDACVRADVKKIGIIYASFPYARSDKKDRPRVSIMSHIVANTLKNAGCQRIISMDIHSGQLQSVVQLPFDNLYDIKYQIQNLKTTVFAGLSQEEIRNNFVLISPDVGGAKRIRDYSRRLEISSSLLDKRRDYCNANTILKSELIGGDVEGKTAIIVDDILDSAGTLISAINDLKNHGMKDCIIVVSHGIFSGPAIERINNCDLIKKVFCTNSIDQTNNCKSCDKISVVDVSGLFGEVIKLINNGGSISKLFE